jgi:hypothetical protein
MASASARGGLAQPRQLQMQWTAAAPPLWRHRSAPLATPPPSAHGTHVRPMWHWLQHHCRQHSPDRCPVHRHQRFGKGNCNEKGTGEYKGRWSPAWLAWAALMGWWPRNRSGAASHQWLEWRLWWLDHAEQPRWLQGWLSWGWRWNRA